MNLSRLYLLLWGKSARFPPCTPRRNGKMERSHRKDNERFYASHTFSSFNDFRLRMAAYNSFPKRP
jgi:hypothetical protein